MVSFYHSVSESIGVRPYQSVILMVFVFSYTTGISINAKPGENIVIRWTMDPLPPSSSSVKIIHPSGSTLYSALGKSVVPAGTDISKRVTNTDRTNTNIGHIEFTLNGITAEDTGNYSTMYGVSGGSEFTSIGVTLLLYGKLIGTIPGSNVAIQWTMDPIPSFPSVVSVVHPSGVSLFSTLGTDVIITASDVGKRVSNTGNTNTKTGHIEFTLNDITVEDAGDYRTQYSYPGRLSVFNLGAFVVLYVRPSKPSITEEKTPVVGNTLILTCSALSNSKPDAHGLEMKYTWYRNGADLPKDDRFNSSGSHLQVMNIQKSDNDAVLTCKAYENVSMYSDPSDRYTTKVKYAPETLILEPSHPRYNMLENETLGPITCSADCSPPCQYRWMQKSENITYTSILNLEKIKRHQNGVYSCIAWNRYGSKSRDVSVFVIDILRPPIQLRAECRSDGMAELLLHVQTEVNASLDVQASTNGIDFRRFEQEFDYPGQQLVISRVFGLNTKATYSFKVISTSDFGTTHSQTNLNCTFLDTTPVVHEGDTMFNAGVTMLVVGLVMFVLSVVITVMMLRRNRTKEESSSKTIEDIHVGSKYPKETSEQNEHYQEMETRSPVYQDLGQQDAPTVYEPLKTGKKRSGNQGQYKNT